MFKKQEFRIIIEVVAGIVISGIINSIFIAIGYATANNATTYTIRELGMPIYKVSGNSGTPIMANMMFSGTVLSIVIVIVVETIIAVRRRDKH